MAASRCPEYECEAMPWPLPNRVTKTICIVAGRDASSALCIALGKHTAASVAHETTYHEPFTYWDWHGVHPDDTYAREWKRQRIWEHQRSFTVDGLHVLGYPTSRERWIRFQESMESHPTRRKWVKRIAVAHWMGSEDLLWIAKNLSELIALDLSDAPIVDTYGQHTWTAFFGPAILGPPAVASKLLGELEWLGLPDFCNHHHDDVASQLVTVVLGHCSSLLTLSIRSRQSSDDNTNPHDYVCKLPSMIASYGSLKLERLELRLPFLCLEALMAGLVKGGSEIRHIGIDLGAWIQLHPKGKKATNDLKESDVRKAARSAAKKQRFDIYEDAHKERFPAEERRRLPESQIESHTAGHTWLYSKNAKHAFENDFYNTDRQSMSPPVPVLTKDHDAAGCEYFDQDRVDDLKRSLSEADPSTLPEMLDDLHRAARNNPNFKLFALEPEWQENSIDPLHPFALIQQPASATSSPASRKSAAPGLNQDVYEWLNKTLKWRPVFDWDSLVRCKDPGHDKAYQQLWNRYGLDSSLSTCQDANAEIAEQLQLLRSAGIPIHILFGRRHTDTSSLYWGWPCDDNAWSKWLAAPFSANIGLIAPLVDTLSIMYDLRDPIEPSSPFGVSSSTCPRPVCPWARVKKTCPYKIQWNPAPISPRGQKLANKHLLRTPPVSKPLAPHIHTLPLPGRYASTTAAFENPHVAATFKREAVGWHRFWSTYSLCFTQLTQLNVRMPVSFENVGSFRLARLLDAGKGWRHVLYADESGDVDVGGFARRTWTCKDLGLSIGEAGASEAEREKEMFEKGVKRVEEAERECEGVEVRQVADQSVPVENGLRDSYGSRIRRVAEEAWRTRVREYVCELSEHDTAGETEQVQQVLQSVRKTLEACSRVFRPEDVFTHDPSLRNDIGLINHNVDYAAEETARRARSAANERQLTEESDNRDLCASDTTPYTENLAYDPPPAQDMAQINHPSAAIHPIESSELQSIAIDALEQVHDSDLPTDLECILAVLQQSTPATVQPILSSNLQIDYGLSIPTDLETILATLQQAGSTIDQQLPPAGTQVPATNSRELYGLLGSLLGFDYQVAGIQDDSARWAVSAVVGDGESDVKTQFGQILEGYQGHESSSGVELEIYDQQLSGDERDEIDFYGEVGLSEELGHVDTLAQCSSIDNGAIEVASTVTSQEGTMHVHTSAGREGHFITVLEQHPVEQTTSAQENVPVNEPVDQEQATTPSVLPQLKESSSAQGSSDEEKPSQPTVLAPSVKSVTSRSCPTAKKATTAKQDMQPKAAIIAETEKSKATPAPVESSKQHCAPEFSATPAHPVHAKATTSERESEKPHHEPATPICPSSSTSARKPLTKRKRKDPVIPDGPIDLSAGRSLRSRSGTPVQAPKYTEHSDESDDGRRRKKGKVRAKRGKKRGADEGEEGNGRKKRKSGK